MGRPCISGQNKMPQALLLGPLTVINQHTKKYSMHCSTTYHVTEGPLVLLLSLTTRVSLPFPEEHHCLTSLQPYWGFFPPSLTILEWTILQTGSVT